MLGVLTTSDPVLSPLLIGRYDRLRPALSGVTISEISNRTNFLETFADSRRLLASLFFDKVLTPVIDAYRKAESIKVAYNHTVAAIKCKKDAIIFALNFNNATAAAIQQHAIELAMLETALSVETNNHHVSSTYVAYLCANNTVSHV